MQRANDEDQLNGGIHGGKTSPSPKSVEREGRKIKVEQTENEERRKGKGGE